MSQKLCEMFCESIFFETRLYAATKNGQINFLFFYSGTNLQIE